MSSAIMQSKGSGEMSSSGHKAFGVLNALTGVGLLENGLPQNTMDELRAYAEEITGTTIYSRDMAATGWDAPSKSMPRSGRFGEASGGLRILIVADWEVAGQVTTLYNAINAHTIHGARCCIYKGDHINFAPAYRDILLDEHGPKGLALLSELAKEADLVHFIRFPVDAQNIKWSRILNPNKTLVQYMGSQLRENAEKFIAWHKQTGVLGVSAWDYSMLESGWLPYHIPLVWDAALSEPKPEVVWRNEGEPLRICHATTRRGFKGTDHFVAVCKELQAEGHPLEFVVIEGKSNRECLEIKQSCHATYDQLSVGIHGLSAIESMGMGHVVIGGISNWALSIHPEVPILRATKQNLKEVIGALCDAGHWQNTVLSLNPMNWVERQHAPQAVAQRLSYLYDFVVNGHRLLP
tara:strand:+ start:216 stop:1439 length:1224 start_codon:yes stop_codon:yes gene_type:complete